jgi:hypothetical protein
MAALSQPQMAALREYVGLGGSLILAGGASWRRTLQPVPADLSPIRAGATISQSLQPVAVLGGGESAPSAPVAVGEIAKQARVTLNGETAPLMAELAYGGGRVITLAFDPAADPVQGLKLAGTSWSQALGRAVPKSRGANGWAASAIPAPSLATAASLPLPDEAPPPPAWLLGLGLLAYMLVIGPLNLALSRRLGRPDLLWVTIPVLAAVSTAGLYLGGGTLHAGNQDEQLQVVRLGPNGSVSTVEYHEILFGQRGQHTLETSPNALLAPMTLGLHQAAAADCPNCVQQLSGLPRDVAEHALPGSHPVIIESGVAYGNVRVVSASSAWTPISRRCRAGSRARSPTCPTAPSATWRSTPSTARGSVARTWLRSWLQASRWTWMPSPGRWTSRPRPHPDRRDLRARAWPTLWPGRRFRSIRSPSCSASRSP